MMTNNSLRHLLRLTLLALPLSLLAQSASQPTPVRLKPDAASPVLTTIPAGNALPSPAPGESAPAGWTAVQVPGPHEVYVDNSDITKSLDVQPGAAYRLEASSSAPVLAEAAAADPVEITGLRGRWTQLRLNKPVTAYVQRSDSSSAAPATKAATPNRSQSTPPRAESSSAAASPTPSAPKANAVPGPGRVAPRAANDNGNLSALPRLFEGRLVTTRRPLRPRRPYDLALEDASGTRIAYVDVSRLLLTDQIENYINRHVAAYGTARPVPESKDIVVAVESLQLR